MVLIINRIFPAQMEPACLTGLGLELSLGY